MYPTRSTIADALERIMDHDRGYPGGKYPWAEDEEPWCPQGTEIDPEVLYGWLLEAERAARAVTQLRQHLEDLMRRSVEADGPIRLGDTIYKTKRDTNPKWAHDHALDALLAWATSDTETPASAVVRVAALFNLSVDSLRVTELKATAVRRAIAAGDTQEEAERAAWAAFDTFLQRPDRDGQPRYVLDKVPVSKAPLWAQALGHGERRQPEREEPT